MVIPFNFGKVPQIYFGTGKLRMIPEIVLKYGKNIIQVIGGSSLKNSGKLDLLMELFSNHGIQSQVVQVNGEPTPEMIDSIVNRFRTKSIDVVLSIGGGSVIDTGKAISAMLTVENSICDYLEGIGDKIHSGIKIPFIAVPTTSGTGSEASKNAVISRIGTDGFKKSIRHDNFVTDIALIDPELMISCPSHITAACGFDAFTQLLEAYVSTKSNSLTDALAISGLEAVKNSLLKAFENPGDIEARTSMAYAALLSGITLANAGLGTVHGFASSVGGYFDIPHGVICGTLLAECVKATISRLKTMSDSNNYLQKYAKVGRLFSENKNKDDIYYCDYLVDLIFDWTQRMNLPRLGVYGVNDSIIDRIVSITDNKNNPLQLNGSELYTILKNRI